MKNLVRFYGHSPAFKKGGLAQVAEATRQGGRGKDDVLLHLSDGEFNFLKSQWGEPDVNPNTGLPEYGFLSDVFDDFKDLVTKPAEATIDFVKHPGMDSINNSFYTARDKINSAKWGSPIHGLQGITKGIGEGGYSLYKASSPAYRSRQAYQQFRDHGISMDSAKDLAWTNAHGIQDAWKANWPAILAFASAGLGSAASAAGEAGSTASTLGEAGSAVGDVASGVGEAGGALSTVGELGSAAGQLAPVVVTGTNAGASLGALGAGAFDAAATVGAAGAGQPSDPNADPNDGSADGTHQTPPHDEKSLLGKTTDYVKNPENWDKILAGVNAVNKLTGGLGGTSDPTPTSAGTPEYLKNAKIAARKVHFDDPNSYYSYGSRPEQQFYTDVTDDANHMPVGISDPNQKPLGAAKGRLVRGPGTGRSDDIDARLSDGEYVMDAETVALLGDGSTDEGARRLDNMRQNLRKQKGKALSKGKFSSDAKHPEEYLKAGK